MSRRYLEEGAIAYRPAPETAKRSHISKKLARNRELEVVFDPKDHKEYLTGFRKRKNQRRKDALQQLESRQRQQRLEERAERRENYKKQLALLEDGDLLEEEEEEKEEEKEEEDRINAKVQTYKAGQLISTVTVCPLVTKSSSSDEDGGGEDGGGDDDNHVIYENSLKPRHHHPLKKMTKAALKAMAKTKLKLEGKKVNRHAGPSSKNATKNKNGRKEPKGGKRKR